MTNGESGTGHDSVGRVGRLRRPRFISAALAVLVMAAPLAVNTLDASSARAANTEALYAFGDNTDGALGNGTTTDAYVPTLITLPGGVTPTGGAAGGDHTLVIGSNGVLYAWGLGTDGQLGNGTTTSSLDARAGFPAGRCRPRRGGCRGRPQLGSGLQRHPLRLGVQRVRSAGQRDEDQRRHPRRGDLPVRGEGHRHCRWNRLQPGARVRWKRVRVGRRQSWRSWAGQREVSTTPLQVPLPSGVTASAIAAGGSFGMAIGSNGNLYSWGDGDMGQLGNGTTTFSDKSRGRGDALGVTASVISAGDEHALAIGSNDLLYSWGDDA